MVSFAVEIFPQRLVRPGQRCFHPRGPRSRANRVHDLVGERRRAFEVIEPNRNRQNVFLAQGRKKPGLDKRRLSQTRHAVEQGKGVAPDQPEQIFDLVPAAREESAVALGEGRKSNPGMLRVRPFA